MQDICKNVTFDKIKDAEKPDFQRELNKDAVKNMVTHIKSQNKKGKSPFFGIIDICHLDDKDYIIDGQHRFEALKKCYNYGIIVKFHIIVYNCEHYSDMLEIFQVRNFNIPIPEYIKRSNNLEERNLCKTINEWINEKEGFDIESKSRPKVNINKFMDSIIDMIEEDEFKNRNITTLDDFKKFYRKQNKIIKEKLKDDDEKFLKKNKGISDNMRKKAKDCNVYIGLLLNLDDWSRIK